MNKELLSIVIPAYNVENYLMDCVESVEKSSYEEREIVLVNDGSTDNTPEICDQLASRFDDVKVVHQDNQGLGYARNAGVSVAQGSLIAFVDSDDRVPEDAYAKMVSSMRKTGSPFVVGGVERFNSQKTWKPWFVEEVHSVLRESTNALQFPPLVWNVFAWSKVFRRDVFDAVVGGFPRGLYEDQVMSARIFTCGEPVDVLPGVVYYWRERENESSITQHKTSVKDLNERLRVAKEVAAIIHSTGDDGLCEYWYRKLLSEDLWWYYRRVPDASMVFWHTLCRGVTELTDGAPPTAIWGAPEKRRDLVALALQGDRDCFVERLARP